MSNKTALNEYCHKNRYVTPRYYAEKDCNNIYTKCAVIIGDTKNTYYGNFTRKKDMENKAAGDMLAFLQLLPNKVESEINLPLLEEKSFIPKEEKSPFPKEEKTIYLIDYFNCISYERYTTKGPFHIFLHKDDSEKLNIDKTSTDIHIHMTDTYGGTDYYSVVFLMTLWCGQNLDYLAKFDKVVLVSNDYKHIYFLLGLLKERGINSHVWSL